MESINATGRDAIAALPKGEFLYTPNPGNAGDAMIACATFQAMRDAKRKWRLLRSVEDVRDKVVVVGGGGSFCEHYTYMSSLLSAIEPIAKELVVLPATVSGHQELLAGFRKNTTIFCREKVSFEHVRETVSQASVNLAHDMALSLDVARLLAHQPSFPRLLLNSIRPGRILPIPGRPVLKQPTPGWFLVWSRVRRMRMLRQYRKCSLDDAVLNAFRVDREGRPDQVIPDDNLDVSFAFSHGVGNEEISHFTVYHWLNFLAEFEMVRTNRIHVAIGSAKLGKQVELHPNNYYKCRAMYEHSLAEAYPNIRWMDD